MSKPSPFSVRVHPFPSKTPQSCAYEYGPGGAPNALVFIGGLTAGPHSNPPARYLADRLQEQEPSYGVWEFRMRSSYTGFGYSSLAHDAEDTAAFVKYLRALGKEKIVLVGHSTGCQNCLEYSKHMHVDDGDTAVDGYVLVAPVSDRETATMLLPPEAYEATLAAAQQMISDGRGGDGMPEAIIPPIFASPVTAYRWNSLAAKGGDDDYFSSDLDDPMLAQTFGRIDKPILILPSGEDELVPPTVDKAALLERWMKASPLGMPSPQSSINPGADHALSTSSSQEWLATRLARFLHDPR